MISRILLILVVSISAVSLEAQDIIHTKKQQQISSKIVAVGADKVNYKKGDQPEGPVFEMPKSEIMKIVYSNGTEDLLSRFTNVSEIKDFIVRYINEYAVDRDKPEFGMIASFDGDLLTVESKRKNRKNESEKTTWDLSKIHKVHKISLRDNGVAYLNIVANQIVKEKTEIEKLVIRMADHEQAERLLEAFSELKEFQ